MSFMHVEDKASFVLPQAFDSLGEYAADLKTFLSSKPIQALLLGHPNELAIREPQSSDNDWWSWACALNSEDVLRFAGDHSSFELPLSITNLLEDASRLALPRSIITSDPLPHLRPKGQSPKKAHEVQHLSQLIARLAKETGIRRVVDVGAGQGYLSLELASKHSLSVLALDSSPVQTSGSMHWAEQAKEQNLKLRHVTHHISSETLPGLVSDFLEKESNLPADREVLVVGLHACGSLTVEVLRACISNIKNQRSGPSELWRVKAAALVGCCYNMLSPEDTHLSSLPAPYLPSDAFQLAAQPWLPPSPSDLSLTFRKIIFRALLGRLLYTNSITIPADSRVRRLKDSSYSSWHTYITAACNRLGIDPALLEGKCEWTAEMSQLSGGLSVLHILRACLGPVIESWILLDRYSWLVEELQGPGLATVQLCWAFDSAISARSAVLLVQAL